MTLIFLYNADSGVFAAAADYIHKIVSPETYDCKLCFVTYDNFGMNKSWKVFLKTIPFEQEFYHKNEFIQKFPEQKVVELPAILIKNDQGQLTNLVSSQELRPLKNQEELQILLSTKLNNLKS